MVQEILVGLVFVIALFYLGRYIYRQVRAGKDGEVYCDKCVPKESPRKK